MLHTHEIEMQASQLKCCINNLIMVNVLQAYFGDNPRKFMFGRGFGTTLAAIIKMPHNTDNYYGLKLNGVCTTHG